MKITKSQLKQIIKEEIEATLDEKFRMAPEQIQKCQKLAGTIRSASALDSRGVTNQAELGAMAGLEAAAREAREEYEKMQCDGVLRNVNEDLY